MCAKLLILESPGKVKKVQKLLGPGWKDTASVSHVRDLPVKEMGVAVPDFKPHYIPTDRGKDVLFQLARVMKNAEEIFPATDSDRERRSYCVAFAGWLETQNIKRVIYTEITEASILTAHPWSPHKKDGGC